jgi:hypothetical protein
MRIGRRRLIAAAFVEELVAYRLLTLDELLELWEPDMLGSIRSPNSTTCR